MSLGCQTLTLAYSATWGWWCLYIFLPLVLGFVASSLVVAGQWFVSEVQVWCAGKRFVGTWDQYLYGNPNPSPARCDKCEQPFPAKCEKCSRELPAIRPLPLVRDPGGCIIRVARKGRLARTLHLIAEHHLSDTVRHRWEGDVVIDRGVHTRAVIAWAYTCPPDIDFGAYQLLAHDRGELFMFPAVPPVPGDYPKFILKRTK